MYALFGIGHTVLSATMNTTEPGICTSGLPCRVRYKKLIMYCVADPAHTANVRIHNLLLCTLVEHESLSLAGSSRIFHCAPPPPGIHFISTPGLRPTVASASSSSSSAQAIASSLFNIAIAARCAIAYYVRCAMCAVLCVSPIKYKYTC